MGEIARDIAGLRVLPAVTEPRRIGFTGQSLAMRVVVRKLGSMAVVPVEDRPTPDHLVRIRVHFAGVNFADMLQVAGKYQERPPLPFVPGGEVAGVVTQLGSRIKTQFAVGARVIALSQGGGYASIVDVEPSRVFEIPTRIPFDVGAAIPVNFGTAMAALRAAQVASSYSASDEPPWVLVTGASGGTGSASVLVAKAFGLRVIAWARGAKKCKHCRDRLKADVVVDIGTSGSTLEAAGKLAKRTTGGRGVDVAVDTVGGDLTKPLLRSLAWNGRLALIGFASGSIPKIPANVLLVKNAKALGIYFGGMFSAGKGPGGVEEGQRCVSDAVQLIADGTIPSDAIVTTRFSLSEPEAAHRALASGLIGKVVLSAGPPSARM